MNCSKYLLIELTLSKLLEKTENTETKKTSIHVVAMVPEGKPDKDIANKESHRLVSFSFFLTNNEAPEQNTSMQDYLHAKWIAHPDQIVTRTNVWFKPQKSMCFRRVRKQRGNCKIGY